MLTIPRISRRRLDENWCRFDNFKTVSGSMQTTNVTTRSVKRIMIFNTRIDSIVSSESRNKSGHEGSQAWQKFTQILPETSKQQA